MPDAGDKTEVTVNKDAPTADFGEITYKKAGTTPTPFRKTTLISPA